MQSGGKPEEREQENYAQDEDANEETRGPKRMIPDKIRCRLEEGRRDRALSKPVDGMHREDTVVTS